MSDKGPGFAITKPVSIWNRPLKANFKDLFKSLSNAIIHGVTGKWDKFAEDAVGALATIGFEKDHGQMAWLLIQRALTQAVFELVAANAGLLGSSLEKFPPELWDRLDLSLEESELTLDKTVFERPGNLPVLNL